MYTLVDFFKEFPIAFWLLLVVFVYMIVVIVMAIKILSWDPKEFKDVKQSKPGETVPESSNNE